MVPGAMVLLVLAKHLDNQDEIIEAVRTSACPQLYYFSVFAPKLIEKVIAEESPDLADSEILISKPKLASDGAFRIRGSVSRKKGIILHSVDFFADFAPEEYYHRPVDWSLKRFEWI